MSSSHATDATAPMDRTFAAPCYGAPPDVLLPPDVLDEGANWKQREPKKMVWKSGPVQEDASMRLVTDTRPAGST